MSGPTGTRPARSLRTSCSMKMTWSPTMWDCGVGWRSTLGHDVVRPSPEKPLVVRARIKAMTFTAPTVDRDFPDVRNPERAALADWLRFHRETLLMKCAG